MNGKIETLLRETGAPVGEKSWTEKVTGIFKKEKVEDPVKAMDELVKSPEVYIDVKNVTITQTRRVATHQVVTGKKIGVPTDSGNIDVICKEIRSDAVAFVMPGQQNLITVAF